VGATGGRAYSVLSARRIITQAHGVRNEGSTLFSVDTVEVG
jgi:hypothetical protein